MAAHILADSVGGFSIRDGIGGEMWLGLGVKATKRITQDDARNDTWRNSKKRLAA